MSVLSCKSNTRFVSRVPGGLFSGGCNCVDLTGRDQPSLGCLEGYSVDTVTVWTGQAGGRVSQGGLEGYSVETVTVWI